MYAHAMALNSKLHQDLEVRPEALEDPDMFGVEVELEGQNIRLCPMAVLQDWVQHNDGSLRVREIGGDAVEYVFKGPLPLHETHQAVKNLTTFLNNTIGVKVATSYRTSIHVHLNFAMDTYRHIYNFITLSLIFDELFVSQNGQHRIGNNFCLRARDAQGQIEELIKSIGVHGNIWGLNGQHRYSSINFVSLLKYGTVEFRSLECTTDYERIEHWINTLQRLKTMARQFTDPVDVIRYYSRMSAKEFLYFILGPQAGKYAEVKRYEEMLHDGMRLAQDFAYCSKWLERKVDDAKPKAKKKEVIDFDDFIIHLDDDDDVEVAQAAPEPMPNVLREADRRAAEIFNHLRELQRGERAAIPPFNFAPVEWN